nr:hypothetical protein [Tanacetum cinerariifolium]
FEAHPEDDDDEDPEEDPIPFPPLPPILSPPSPILSPAPPPSLIRFLGYRAAMIRLRDKAASTFHSPYPLLVARRTDQRLPYHLGRGLISLLVPDTREREICDGITDSWDEIVETLQGAPVSTDMELGEYVREFETRIRQDT